MTTFTLNEVQNHIPKCIICQKIMYTRIDINLSAGYRDKNLYQNSMERSKKFHLILKPKDDFYIIEYNNVAIKICKDDTPTIMDIIDSLNIPRHRFLNYSFSKKCKTCAFHLYFESSKDKDVDVWLEFTINADKRILLHGRTNQLIIRLNGSKIINAVPINFEKTNSLNKLKNKIETIITFR